MFLPFWPRTAGLGMPPPIVIHAATAQFSLEPRIPFAAEQCASRLAPDPLRLGNTCTAVNTFLVPRPVDGDLQQHERAQRKAGLSFRHARSAAIQFVRL